MEPDELYELVAEAVRDAMDERDPLDVRIAKRYLGGRVLFEDADGRQAKEVPILSLFKKVTSVRDKLRVLEQKVNNSRSLDDAERAELQTYITRAYGSLTTFNFLFADRDDGFRGTGKH